MPQEKQFLSNRVTMRATFIELLVVAVVLAVGINLATSVLSSRLSISTQVVIAAILLLGALAFLVRSHFRPLIFSEEIEGVLFFDRTSLRLLEAGDYELSSSCERYIVAAFNENPALERQWTVKEDVPRPGDADPESKRVMDLIHELVEYAVLEIVGLSLSSHFTLSKDHRESELQTLRRNDLPAILLGNRFLELFSRPIRDRALFSEQDSMVEHSGEVMTIIGPDTYFHRFEISLPKDGKIDRDQRDLVILSPSIDIRISINYRGISAYVPPEFIRSQMNRDPYVDVHPQKVTICIEVKAKRNLRHSRSRLNQDRWAEAIVNDLREQMDFGDYMQRIQWPVVHAMLTGADSERRRGEQQVIEDAPTEADHTPTANDQPTGNP